MLYNKLSIGLLLCENNVSFIRLLPFKLSLKNNTSSILLSLMAPKTLHDDSSPKIETEIGTNKYIKFAYCINLLKCCFITSNYISRAII